MQARLLGVQNLHFNNENGDLVKGDNIFVAFKDENIQGMRTERFFVKEEIGLPEGVKINDVIDISFKFKGKIERITKA